MPHEYTAEVDVAVDDPGETAIGAIEKMIEKQTPPGTAKVTLIAEDGPAGGAAIVEIKADVAVMSRFLRDFFVPSGVTNLDEMIECAVVDPRISLDDYTAATA